MTQHYLDRILWTAQTRLEEEVLQPMEKLLHNNSGNNVRFFSSASRPMEKNVLAANLQVISTLIRAAQDCQLAITIERIETAADTQKFVHSP